MVLTLSPCLLHRRSHWFFILLSILGIQFSGLLLPWTLYSQDLGEAIFLQVSLDLYVKPSYSLEENVDNLLLNRLYYSFSFKVFPIEKCRAFF